jgi:hypothetical protein
MPENQPERAVLTGIAAPSYDDQTILAHERSFDSVSAFPTVTSNVSSHDFLMQQVATVTDSSDD